MGASSQIFRQVKQIKRCYLKNAPFQRFLSVYDDGRLKDKSVMINQAERRVQYTLPGMHGHMGKC